MSTPDTTCAQAMQTQQRIVYLVDVSNEHSRHEHYGMTYLNRFSKTKSSEARLHTTYSVTLSFMVPKWDKNR